MHPRLSAMLNAPALGRDSTGFDSFDLHSLELTAPAEFVSTPGLRLGHLAEKAVAALLHASKNYRIVDEHVQLVVEKQTLGELDFLIQDLETDALIHLELAYKFYLYDPAISDDPLQNWIGPNRKDSLVEKLTKLKKKQFPLLYHDAFRSRLAPIEVDRIAQKLCFLVSLYLPYGFTVSIGSLQSAVRGCYYDLETFARLDHPERCYFIPSKPHWGIDPSTHEGPWHSFYDIKIDLQRRLADQRAPLIWIKQGEGFLEGFVVWWKSE